MACENPVELFDMKIAHVGINAGSPTEAKELAKLIESLMGLPAVETPISVFSGTLIETMSGKGRGTHGHIGFYVNDLPAAEAWFSSRGLEINEESRALLPDGSTKLVYFKQEIGGFAIHLSSSM